MKKISVKLKYGVLWQRKIQKNWEKKNIFLLFYECFITLKYFKYKENECNTEIQKYLVLKHWRHSVFFYQEVVILQWMSEVFRLWIPKFFLFFFFFFLFSCPKRFDWKRCLNGEVCVFPRVCVCVCKCVWVTVCVCECAWDWERIQ